MEHIEEIVDINGVDGIFIGPYDLSIGLGKPAQFTDPDFIKAINRIHKACKDAGKFLLAYVPDSSSAKKYFDNGFDGVAVSIDVAFYINAIKTLIKEVRDIK